MALTGRPKSQNPKRHNVCIRLTDGERSELEERYGSAANGLRALVNAELTVGARSEPRAPRGPEVAGVIVDEHEQMPEFVATPPDGKVVTAKAHVHRPDVKIGEVYYRDGQGYQRWMCECGKELDRRAS